MITVPEKKSLNYVILYFTKTPKYVNNLSYKMLYQMAFSYGRPH